MNRENFASLLEHVNAIPVAPKVVRELMAECETPDADVDRIARLLGSDPVLATRILRLANSAFYARKSQISRLQEAVIFVGTHATRNLVMSMQLASMIRLPPAFPTRAFWHYSVNCAVATQYLAKEARQDAETGFAVGLVRGIGLPIVATGMRDGVKEVDAICPFYDYARTSVERDRLGFSHVEVSVALAQHWSFPAEMITPLAQSERRVPSAEGSKMGAIVAAGAWLAGEYEWGSQAPSWIPDHARAHLRAANLDDEIVRQMPSLNSLSADLASLTA